jgi:hydrogenase/urease accessory protein HupE
MKSYLLSALAIVASAIPASFVAWWVTSSLLGLSGIPLALATVALAMVLSVALFAALSAIGHALGVVK